MAPQCKKCNSPMYKEQTIIASNSKYELYVCEKCGNEEQFCRGVI